jgi:hypothetical protein
MFSEQSVSRIYLITMLFKDFITKQRIGIFVFGGFVFAISLLLSSIFGDRSLWSDLFIDLAASSFTIVFTALIIDYLSLKEQTNRTKSATDLAENEIRATCFRIKLRMARLFGFDSSQDQRDNLSTKEEARQYLDKMTKMSDNFLSDIHFDDKDITIDISGFEQYLERLQTSQNQLEQTLILYEYALSYSLRERILSLRSELQITERLLGFIDSSESLNEANLSLIRITSQAVYDAVQAVLTHDSQTLSGTPIHARPSPLKDN